MEAIHKKLLSEFKNHDMQAVRKSLDELQLAIYDSSKQKPKQPEAVFTILKDFCEINALYYVNESNLEQFGYAIKEVLAFYETQKQAASGANAMKSEQQNLMFGLHLMYLLSTNKIAEFHMFIEKIDYEKRKTDPFLDVPIKLERFMMEGAYNSMNLTESCLPSPYYKPFMNMLKQAVQNEIAIGLEMSYRSIPIKIAIKQLFLVDEKEALAFGNKRGWIRKGNEFLIAGNELADPGAKQPTLALASGAERVLQPLESGRIIQQLLQYANQLERIV